ncbi:hypothetical protein B0A49_09525 [Cryomyces minteri]|uniref:Major facilitator superfamily (MFS) profile domain-containing protein n=1 Tax=Cryomyces minteri TaxID=331657 RepID=A0A4U0WI31_9PEZI|nr:hypothetical protein B0A49_09525 [Cryomyces minteri]
MPPATDKDRAVLAGVYLSDNNDSGTTIQAPNGQPLDVSKPLPPNPWGRPGGTSRVPIRLNFPPERPGARSQNGSRLQPSLYPVSQHREARRILSRESARTQPHDDSRTYSSTTNDGYEVESKEPHVFPTELPPRPPSRTRQAMRASIRSISALSILPGDMLYPPPALHHSSGDGALRTLGLNDRRQAPAVFELQRVAEEGRTRPSSSSHTLVETPRISTTNAGVVPPTEATESSKVGRMAWAHALMGFFIIFNIWGMNNAFGVFQSYYARVLLPGTSPATIAWIGSFQLFLVFGLGTPIGRAVDAGHFRVFFNVGSALLVVLVFATSWCATWWQLFLVQGVLTGAAMGMVFCSGLVVLMSYFNERNIGLALGLGAAGSSLGGIAYAVLAQRLLPTHGFAWTIRITGCLCLGTMIAPNLVFRQRPELRARARQRLAGKFQLLDWDALKEGSYLLMAAGLGRS